MTIAPVHATPDAYKLFHEATLALSDIERGGMRIDVAYLKKAIKKTKNRIVMLEEDLKADSIYKEWRKRYGERTNLDSRDQLGKVLFGALGYRSAGYTERTKDLDEDQRRYRADVTAFDHLKDEVPFVGTYLEAMKLKKLEGTYLRGVLRETVDGFLHPVFHVHTVRSYRTCIAKGTKIETVRDVAKHPKGVPIEDVRAGDHVYCYNDQKQLVVRKVLWAGQTGTRKVVRLHWRARGKKGILDLTPDHKVRLASGQYVQAQKLVGDFRGPDSKKKAPKIQVLSLGRVGHRLFPTNAATILDHRLVYEQLVGPLEPQEVVHHRDSNHFNNIPTNLEAMSRRGHSAYHAPESFTNEGRRKGAKNRQRNHQLYGDRFPFGVDNGNWFHVTKFGMLRMLAKCAGKWSKVGDVCFMTVRKKCKLLGIDLKVMKRRYDWRGRYLSRGRLLRSVPWGRARAQRKLKVGYYTLKELYRERGIPITRRWANQCGEFVPNNHRIVKVEWINKVVDVYDLEVEECHNFIANEICVHNSSSEINFQNIPIRDPEIGKIIRRAFIAEDGFLVGENDLSGAEVRTTACITKDPALIKYILDPKTDMHRDMACQIYKITPDMVEPAMLKRLRQQAKGPYVFATFYGSVYFQTAPALWDALDKEKYALKDGTSLRKHLEKKGIRELGICDPKRQRDPMPGTFEHHMKKIDDDFWNRRFKQYGQWKRDFYAAYLRNGGFWIPTGFYVGGLYKKNDVTNYPSQGCLAGSSKVLTKRGWIPIKELVGTWSEVWTGFKWADAIGLNRGEWQRAVITLSSGLRIKCDTRHKLKNEKDEWVDFKDLKEGDYVALPKTEKTVQPNVMMNWAFIFGFIIGDGCISNVKRKSVSITVGRKKKQVLEKMRDFVVAQGYTTARWWVTKPNPKNNRHEKYHLCIENKKFSKFLESKGFVFGWKSNTKRVPQSVWVSSLQEQRDFMEGLWLSDGARAVWSKRNLHMANPRLLREVQILTSALGFDSILKEEATKANLMFHWRTYNAKTPRRYPFTAVARQVKDVKWTKYEDKCQATTDRRNWLKGESISQYVAERIIRNNAEKDPVVYRYDQIKSIKVLEKIETTYTMSVDDPLHQFVADGVIHKNSAAHCLLWAMVQVHKWLRKYKMKTRITGQIHDSMTSAIYEKELQDYLNKVYEVFTVDLPKHWPWIIVPIVSETDVAPPGASWFDKKPWVRNEKGLWIEEPKK